MENFCEKEADQVWLVDIYILPHPQLDSGWPHPWGVQIKSLPIDYNLHIIYLEVCSRTELKPLLLSVIG